MPIPLPTETNAKLSAAWPCPWLRSASAAASTSFSTTRDWPNAARRSASTAGRSQPGRPPVRAIELRRGSYTPGLPITVWVTADRAIPASAHRSSASRISSPTRPRTLDARDGLAARARMPPARSASAPRTYLCPMSSPST